MERSVVSFNPVLAERAIMISSVNGSFKDESLTSSEMFEFDFPEDLSVSSDLILPDFDGETTPSCDKASSHKNGGKFPHKRSKKYKPRIMETYTGVRCVKPNMSRRTRDMKLYAFPSFDKCDSLLFFPTTLTKYLNSGDITSVGKLLQSHLDKNCEINLIRSSMYKLSMPLLVQIYEIRNDLHPDRITCIHTTEVDGNTIKAVGFSKFTYCKAIYNSVANIVKNSNFELSPKFQKSWTDYLRNKIEGEVKSPDLNAQFMALIDSGCDLVVYSRTEFLLTVDDTTKKVKSLALTGTTTAMQEARHDLTML